MLKAQVIGRDSVAQTRKQRLKSWMLVAPWNYLGISLSQVLVRNMDKMQTITHSNITFVSLSNSLCLTESCQIYEINMTMAGLGAGGSNMEIPSHHIPGVAWIQTTFCHNHITNSSFLQLNFSISYNSMVSLSPLKCLVVEHTTWLFLFLPTKQALTLIQHMFFKLENFSSLAAFKAIGSTFKSLMFWHGNKQKLCLYWNKGLRFT